MTTALLTLVADLPWIVWVIAWPLAMATVALLLPGRRTAPLALVTAAGALVAVTGLTVRVWVHGAERYHVGGWEAPLGIDLHADGLSVLMLLATAVVGTGVTVYGAGYFAAAFTRAEATRADGDAGEYFWPLWLFLWGALNALFLSADLFNVYVTLELVTLASVALVALAGHSLALQAALRYLLAAILGSLGYLAAVALLYGAHGTLDVASLGRSMTSGHPAIVAVVLATTGLLVKTALFPLHFWLPAAHAVAPAPASALLSGLVVKASFYVLLRLWFDVFRGPLGAEAGAIFGALGAAAIVWGSVQALVAPRLKLLVAYSTVAQIGYLFLMFPLALDGDGPAAWYGGAFFVVSHACAKAAMFLAAGNIRLALGHDRIIDLGTGGAALSRSFFTIGLAGVSLMGLPPSGGFVAKWMLLDAAIRTGRGWIAAVIIIGGLLAAGYIFRVLRRAFTMTEPAVHTAIPVPLGMQGAAFGLALTAVMLGVLAGPALVLLEIGAPLAPEGMARIAR